MPNIIQKSKKLLLDICDEFKENDRDIMQGVDGEKLHALDVLEWIEKLNPDASTSLKVAAIFHDVDRIVTPKAGGGFKGSRGSVEYEEHKKMHAKRSAEFIIPRLKKIIEDKKIIQEIQSLIIHHDDTGREVEGIDNLDLNYLVAADSFAFFTSIAPKLYAAEGEKRIKDKIQFMIEKMPEFAREMLQRHKIQNEIFNNLKNEVIREYYKDNIKKNIIIR
jgi:hypothetical protein